MADIAKIAKSVCRLMEVSIEELTSANRKQRIAFARHMLCYLAREDFHLPLAKIARKINRDHSTVLNSVKAAQDLLVTDSRFKRQHKELLTTIRGSSMQLRPLYHHVIVRMDPPDQTYGSIIIPDAGVQPKRSGTVIAHGEGRIAPDMKIIPLRIKVGDKVLLGEYSGMDVDWMGETLRHMREDEIIAIIDEE